MSGTSDAPSLRLDATREEALEQASAIVMGAWQSFDRARPGQPEIDERLHELLRAALPEEGSSALQALDDAAQLLDVSIAQPRPRFFAFVGSSGLEIGVLGDLLASCFDVNLAVWAGAASEVEDQAVRWVSEFIGYPAAAGAFTSGGTISNVTALAAARERALPGARRTGMTAARGALYCSREAHYSVVRSAELLGLGSEQVRSLPQDDRRRLRPDAVAKAIDADRSAGVVPVAVVATAGTTLTGVVDPVDALAEVCEARGVWLHVDGAYGVAAASTASAGHLFAGVERADSVTLDAHKWLFLPKACGVVLVRRHEDLHGALAHEEDYIPHERPDHHMVDITLEYSRPFRALKLWLAFRAHGAEAIRAAIERNLGQARLLYAEVSRHDDLEHLCEEPQLSIVPFRHVPAGVEDLDEHNARLVEALQANGDVWVAPARVDGKVCLRPCIVNYRTTDDDVRALVDVTRGVGAVLASANLA
ncbi:MAG TPA: aminotransferase class V-fold PLP-dependent enzyme [Gaiella sp.]|jgi:aromatic-L-amino-acid decarboxylase|nr:aminotransferase class V-fold PLP-dependent enzyme [Gaiella sp.]